MKKLVACLVAASLIFASNGFAEDKKPTPPPKENKAKEVIKKIIRSIADASAKERTES